MLVLVVLTDHADFLMATVVPEELSVSKVLDDEVTNGEHSTTSSP